MIQDVYKRQEDAFSQAGHSEKQQVFGCWIVRVGFRYVDGVVYDRQFAFVMKQRSYEIHPVSAEDHDLVGLVYDLAYQTAVQGAGTAVPVFKFGAVQDVYKRQGLRNCSSSGGRVRS